MEKKKGLLYSLAVVLLVLCIAFIGKLLLFPTVTANAAGGQYQVSCAGAGDSNYLCAVISVDTGQVVNVFAPSFAKMPWCNWDSSSTDCNKLKK